MTVTNDKSYESKNEHRLEFSSSFVHFGHWSMACFTLVSLFCLFILHTMFNLMPLTMFTHGCTHSQFDHFSFSKWRILLLNRKNQFTYWRHKTEYHHFHHTTNVEIEKKTESILYVNWHFVEAKCSKFYSFVSHFELDLAIK